MLLWLAYVEGFDHREVAGGDAVEVNVACACCCFVHERNWLRCRPKPPGPAGEELRGNHESCGVAR